MAKFEQAIGYVLDDEGSDFTDDSDDHGGPTRWGITLEDLKGWRKDPALVAQDVANLTRMEACSIYKAFYWDRLSLDDIISQSVATAIFDQGVNRGPGMAVIMAQAALNEMGFMLERDGSMGPKTQAAVNSADIRKFIYQYFIQAQKRYVQICQNDRSQIRFLAGWLSRSQKMISLIL